MIRKLLIVRGNRRGDNFESQATPFSQNDDIFLLQLIKTNIRSDKRDFFW
jgi:hypothetical protein